MKKYPEIRYIIGPPRSGTSAFQRALCQISGQPGIYEPIRYEQLWGGGFKGRIFKTATNRTCHPLLAQAPHKPHILKDIMGYNFLEEAASGFSNSIIKRSQPVFIFRDPMAATNSLKKAGWYSAAYFIESYERGYHFWKNMHDKGLPVSIITQEEATSAQGPQILQTICQSWGLGHNIDPAQWSDNYFDLVHYEPEQKAEISKSGSHGSLINSKGLSGEFNKKSGLILTKKEQKLVTDRLQPLYDDICKHSLALSL